MIYHMRDMKRARPAPDVETLAQALIACALALFATALLVALGAVIVF